MKRKLIMFVIFIVGIITIAACGETTPANFSEEPTVTAATAAGELVLKAKAENEEGIIFWAVYNDTVTEVSKEAVIAGHESIKSGQAIHVLNATVKLDADKSYSVFFVIQQGKSSSNVIHVTQKTNKVATLGFSALAVASGDENGTVKINAQTNGVGEVYFVLVAEGSAAPSVAQIVAGTNYGDVEVVAANHGASISNHVVSGLTPNAKYDGHFVIKNGEEYSTIRKMTGTAKRVVEIVDKGEGTEESPFRISTIEDLEAIGIGLYEVTDKEWNMDSHYVLENDINLTEKYGAGKLDWPVLGTDAAGSRFAGTLDGAGHAIIGLYIGADSEAGIYRGLFASSENTAVVKNLVIKNSYVRDSGMDESNPNHGTGLLFGYFKGLIENVSVYESEVYATGTRVGGLAGRSYVTGSIYNTYVNVKVTGVNRVGGYVGVVDVDDNANKAIELHNLVFDGSVIGKENHIGGIAGYARGMHIANAIVLGYIQGQTATGGIVGFYQKRSGNNNVAANIENTIVYATVYGTAAGQMIGYTIGNKSAAGSVVNGNDLLKFANNYYVEGSAIHGNGVGSADSLPLDGTMITTANLVDADWYFANMPTMDFDAIFEIKEDAQRASLVGTLDEGLLPELVVPLVALVDVKAGVAEKELVVLISSNKEATIYYVVVANEMELTADQIKDPSELEGKLQSGSGASINATYTMGDYDTTYYVYYYVEALEGDESILDMSSGKSKEMTALVISGGLRPGFDDSDVIINLSTNLPSTIYYIIVAAEGDYTKEQIISGAGALFADSDSVIENVRHYVSEANVTYYFYAIAIAADRESAVTFGEGLSSSSDVVNYGQGTAADPFIIRTVTDFEKIGRGSYTNEAGEVLNYANNMVYQIVANIDLTEKYGDGKASWTPIPELKAGAVIDGGSFTVKGLYINSNTAGQKGFITHLNNGTVKNIIFEDAQIISSFSAAATGNGNSIGIVAGRAQNATFTNIRIINGLIDAPYIERVGGVVGEASLASVIQNVYVEADVTGNGRVGGIAGTLSNDAVTPLTAKNIVFIGNLVITVNLGTERRIGGIAGWSRGVAYENIYIEASISTTNAEVSAGALAGLFESQAATNLNASIKNVIANVKIVGGVLTSTTLFTGTISKDKGPSAATGIYFTEHSAKNSVETFTDAFAEVLPTEINAQWFETNMPGLLGANWELVAGNDRPQLKKSPDTGLINQLS